MPRQRDVSPFCIRNAVAYSRKDIFGNHGEGRAIRPRSSLGLPWAQTTDGKFVTQEMRFTAIWEPRLPRDDCMISGPRTDMQSAPSLSARSQVVTQTNVQGPGLSWTFDVVPPGHCETRHTSPESTISEPPTTLSGYFEAQQCPADSLASDMPGPECEASPGSLALHRGSIHEPVSLSVISTSYGSSPDMVVHLPHTLIHSCPRDNY